MSLLKCSPPLVHFGNISWLMGMFGKNLSNARSRTVWNPFAAVNALDTGSTY